MQKWINIHTWLKWNNNPGKQCNGPGPQKVRSGSSKSLRLWHDLGAYFWHTTPKCGMPKSPYTKCVKVRKKCIISVYFYALFGTNKSVKVRIQCALIMNRCALLACVKYALSTHSTRTLGHALSLPNVRTFPCPMCALFPYPMCALFPYPKFAL